MNSSANSLTPSFGEDSTYTAGRERLAQKLLAWTLSGALAVSGAVGIVGVQAVAPDGSGALQQAQAKTVTGTVSYRIDGNDTTRSHIVFIKTATLSKSKLKIKLVGTVYNRGTVSKISKSKRNLTFKLSKKVKYKTTQRSSHEKKISLKKAKKLCKSLKFRWVSIDVVKGKAKEVVFDLL